MDHEEDRPPPGSLIEGKLSLGGMSIDLGRLLSSPEAVKEQLSAWRQALKRAGARETVSDEDWLAGRPGLSGSLRTRGPLGEREYHLGTRRASPAAPPEVAEPVTDVFYEDDTVRILSEVPGAAPEDIVIGLTGTTLTLATGPGARWKYQKTLSLECDVDFPARTVRCRNGILEVCLPRVGPGS